MDLWKPAEGPLLFGSQPSSARLSPRGRHPAVLTSVGKKLFRQRTPVWAFDKLLGICVCYARTTEVCTPGVCTHGWAWPCVCVQACARLSWRRSRGLSVPGPSISVPGPGVSAECTCFPELPSSVALSPRYHITAIGVPERPEAQGAGMGLPSWL